ncbi:MAG: hypothetical protein HUJ27_15880 [Rhodobacteraceae bacterium]|nr:hypothetical protein [Paracoccaceae bacterium]
MSQATDRQEESQGLRLLLVALAAAVLFHGGLLPFTHGNTYDAYIHMFFGDHYHRSWFDPWEPRWYTGFATTSYPPGTHMAMGALMYVMPLRAAFIVVQMTGLILLVIGVYRFALLWVRPRAAGYAAVALTLSSSISETIHLFGQLPTICSLGIFLNGLPSVYRWIVFGKFKDFVTAVVFAAATTAAHHVTTIFGGVLFIIPLALQALRAVAELSPMPGASRLRRARRFVAPFARGLVLAVFMLSAIVITVFPYWYWSISDPITQVPIPHGSRESFIERLDLGFIFFALPWGMAILFLPYAVYKTFTTRLWPLGLSVILCFILGTGGTTPISRAILRGAFDILTLDRFTFWATILILPFLGLMFDGLLHGRSGEAVRRALGQGVHRLIVGGIFGGMTGIAVFAAILPTIQPTQPDFIDPTPIARFLDEDEHDRWRYLTLGFGDQFAYVSAQTTAQSVDGNYHSARRLPDMTRFSVERLENAKYLGVPGLGSLRQFIENAERYHLKYVFSNDAFYDPLLHFSGWTRLNRLSNGVVVWEKPDISPLPLFQPRIEIPRSHAMMWGILPPAALLSAGLLFALSALRRNFGAKLSEFRPVQEAPGGFTNPRRVRLIVLALGLATVISASGLATMLMRKAATPLAPDQVIAAYFDNLDFRRFDGAYALLDPETRGDFEEVMFNWRWKGGLLASYGKLADMDIKQTQTSPTLRDWEVKLHWLTAVDMRTETLVLRTVKRGDHWFVVPMGLRPVQTPVRLQRQGEVAWNVVGRRQPRADTDLHRDRLDRPRIAIDGARVVRRDGRYSVLGQVTNADADPAAVTLFANLEGTEKTLAWQAAGRVNGQRLLPAESAGFRVDFEGVLSLEAAETRGEFDPTLFIPPELEAAPDAASMEARALVTGRDLYRGVSLNGIRAELVDGAPVLTGLAVNTGTKTATITRINVLLFGLDGSPIWAEAGFVETNLYPGQSAPFSLALPAREEIEVIAEIPTGKILTNGSQMQADLSLPGADAGTLPLDPETGYRSMRLLVTSMTHDPLF